MVERIENNRTDVSKIPANQAQILRVATNKDLEYCDSILTRADEGTVKNMTGSAAELFNTVWSGFKWVLSKVFFCYDLSGVIGKNRLELLEDLLKAATGAKVKLQELVNKHNEDREALRNEWKEFFDGLPKELKDDLIGLYFQALAKGKDLTEEKEIQTFVNACFKNEEKRNLALGYVYELNIDGWDDPCDELINESFDAITKNIKEEITKLKTK